MITPDMSRIISPASPVGQAAIDRAIASLEAEIDSAQRQIEAGKYPAFDANCRAYIRETHSILVKWVAFKEDHLR